MGETEFKKLQREVYQKESQIYEKKYHRENRNHLKKIRLISDFLSIKPGEKVLEIGVGTGIHADYLMRMNGKTKFEFYGVDYSPEMIQESKRRLKSYKNVRLDVCDGEHLTFEDEKFDKVYISGSLHHFFSPKKGISELLRVLKKGGKFCIMEPNYYFLKNLYAAHFIKEEKNVRLMKKGVLRSYLNRDIRSYNMENVIFTPPMPKNFETFYDKIDELLKRIPLIKESSMMVFVKGEK